jgi:hypothetical protein
VLGCMGRGHAVDSRDGDLGTSYVHSQDHAAFLSPGLRPCKLRGSGAAAISRRHRVTPDTRAARRCGRRGPLVR